MSGLNIIGSPTMAVSKLSLPWGLNLCLQISPPLSGLAGQLFQIQKRFPRSDPPSKILYRFLTVRFAQCLSFGIRHSFELIATARIAKVVPFRMETRAWPVVTWGQLNIAIPIKAGSTFCFYKGLCKQNMSLQGGVSHFAALTWKLDKSSLNPPSKPILTLQL